jgi:hypothetical protein
LSNPQPREASDKKGATGVLHEVPAVGNLDGIRERLLGSALAFVAPRPSINNTVDSLIGFSVDGFTQTKESE